MNDAGTTRIRVAGESPYDVVIGNDVLGEVASMLGPGVRRVAVVHPRALAAAVETIGRSLESAGYDATAIEVPDGEAAKTSDVAAACWAALGKAGFTRSDAVVGVGGGATTDLAGFVAATFLRGIGVVHVPTSLLAMVDAAVGGKTGINTVEGKNLVGSFHEPAGVVCDLGWLASLPRADLVSGLAEVVKCGFIADPVILDLVSEHPREAANPASPVLRELVERAVSVKARVVEKDLREATSVGSAVGREALNYGHTLGHAIERVEVYRIRHGEAVSVGMMFAAELARLSGHLDATTADLHREVLTLVGLPTSYQPERWEQLYDAMRIDKKARGDRLRFVVLEGVGSPAILEGPDDELLVAAYLAIS
ncbi:MAG: 3-dehydroquinate synthase [Nocardioidaceae bacterium]|nr:3-dehydroquinate synthase [Nocardioidaceae bacterium]